MVVGLYIRDKYMKKIETYMKWEIYEMDNGGFFAKNPEAVTKASTLEKLKEDIEKFEKKRFSSK